MDLRYPVTADYTTIYQRLTAVCQENGWQLYMPELPLCGDNAAMIGAQGYYELLAGNTAGMDLNGRPYMEIDSGF